MAKKASLKNTFEYNVFGGFMAITTVRLEDEELRDLNSIGAEAGFDQSTTLREALRKGVREMRIDVALEKYRKHSLSFSQATKLARLSAWELLEEMKTRNMHFQTDDANLEENIRRELD